MSGKWAHARKADVKLSFGTAKIERLSMDEAIYYDHLPNPLRGIAIKAEEGFALSDIGEDGMKEFFDLKVFTVARQTKEITFEDGENTRKITEEDVKQWTSPDRDRAFAAITHIITRDAMRDVAAALLDAAPFRSGEDGAEPADGGDGDGKAAE